MRQVVLMLMLTVLVGCSSPTAPVEPEGPVVARCHTVINDEVYFYECGTTPPTDVTLLREVKQ